MDDKKISACLFVHYSVTNALPHYVTIYVNELSEYFDKVTLLTNNSKISAGKTSLNSNISFEYFENRGYDFGMIYRFLSKQDINSYYELAIVNDSNLLINKLDKVFEKGRKSKAGFWGMIDSAEKPWFSTHRNNYHLQSHFLVLNETAIKLLPAYFDSIDTGKIFNEPDRKELRRMVINYWEIGLSQYLLSLQLASFSFIETKKLQRQFKTRKHNLTFTHYIKLLENGYLLIKKKALLQKKIFGLFDKTAQNREIITRYANSDWDIEEILKQ